MPGILINIDVPDLDKATRFYVEALQLSVGRKFDNRFIEILGATAPIYLLQNDEGTNPLTNGSATRTYKRHWTPVHMDFTVDNLEVAVERVTRAGARQEGNLEEKPYGKIAYFADPFGNGFCLIEFSAEGYDALLPG